MATKNIEAVLKWVGQGDAPPELVPALAELNAIRAAMVTFDEWRHMLEGASGTWHDSEEIISAVELATKIAGEGKQ